MPRWLRRLVSPTYRRALAAEAAGDYAAAAQAYGLAGMPAKVAEMHMVRALRAEPARRVDALADALHWIAKAADDEAGADLRRALAEALVEEARALPAGDPKGLRLAREGALLHEKAGSMRAAGVAYELAGQAEDAVRCYEAGGDIDRMEKLLEAETRSSASSRAARECFDEYEAGMGAGRRDLALRALRRCVAEAPGQGYEQLAADLEARLPRDGVIDLVVDGERVVLVGRAPASIGRGEADVRLRNVGISRRHAVVDSGPQGFSLRDAGSRNGTLLNGLRISGDVPLVGSGTIGLGDECTLEFSASDTTLRLQAATGPDKGLVAIVARGAWEPHGAGVRLSFQDGRTLVESTAGGQLSLNGSMVAGPVVLIRGDVVECPAGGRIEVTG